MLTHCAQVQHTVSNRLLLKVAGQNSKTILALQNAVPRNTVRRNRHHCHVGYISTHYFQNAFEPLAEAAQQTLLKATERLCEPPSLGYVSTFEFWVSTRSTACGPDSIYLGIHDR